MDDIHLHGSSDHDDQPHMQDPLASKIGGVSEDNMRLPIVDHIEKLDHVIKDLGDDQKDCGKYISDTRVDLANLERLEKETSGDYTQFLLDETARLEKEFKRLCDVENSESDFLKQQISHLNKDKFKINQNVAILDERIRETEQEVGMKYFMG